MLVAKHEPMDRKLCQRMHPLPTKQKSNAPDTHPDVPLMHQAPAMCASERLEAAWDRKVGVPLGMRMDSKTGFSSRTGLATRKQRVGAHTRASLRSAV